MVTVTGFRAGQVPRVVKLLVGLVVAVLVVLGVAGVLGFNLFQPRTTDRSQPVLLKSIQDISQYHAAVGNFEVIIDIDHDVPYLPDILVSERTLFVAAGTVNAYIDLSAVTEQDLVLSADGKSVAVRLPEPVLDKPNLDSERSYLFAQQRGVWNRLKAVVETPNQQEFYKLAEEKLAAAAAESELARRTTDNTRAMLVGLFNSLGKQVTFPSDRG